jgi:hypothetical protein
MTLTPGLRKGVLAAHLAVSVGWLGAIVPYLALGVTAVTSRDLETVRASWLAMERIGWYAIVPLALASLFSGVIMGLGTQWGLFRHYWVLISLLLTIIATTGLLLHMPTVSLLARIAQEADPADLVGGLGGDLFHAGVGLLILLVIQVLNVFKPAGMTRYGWRKQHEPHSAPRP